SSHSSSPLFPYTTLFRSYRSIVRPLLDYIDRVENEEQPDWLTVVLPEVVPARWWHNIFHNQTALAIKAALLFRPNVVVTSVPYRSEEHTSELQSRVDLVC